ncbi:5,10-methylenetetrahydrofolate reductase [Roseicyclus mahoneyensis]|uniref:5,10-methylenetetrahydrofolate reductase n=1 Tax=Roseicyclus mahoneyensis TaxID=164332 RepID=A0A316GPS6_9RHOB|nr:5,10-methylenetetrahydrofolate reductase [Roseicyclus mahoneyensis]PWK62411.1 5,10-methylenetetrahydrofolate reductase [Roseicyclus mahoneyensis]
MALLKFRVREAAPASSGLEALLKGFSIEVMPRTAEKVADFRQLLPAGTRVYIAHIDGTPFEDMLATARRLRAEGFEPMPHFPARSIPDRATLSDMVARYRGEADVQQGLIIAGGIATPRGAFHSSMQMLETGLFDAFTRIHVAGHPEGNRDIDADGGEDEVMAALRWKQAFADRSNAEFAIATQFAFQAAPVLAWADRLAANKITMPIHLGIAGPAKLQTLIKFAIACGVGPSLSVLQKRARDVSKLLLPFEPDDILTTLAHARAEGRATSIEAIHFFPLGGIKANADWTIAHGGASAAPAAAT